MTSSALPQSRRTNSAQSDFKNNPEMSTSNKWHHNTTHLKHTPSPSLFSGSDIGSESTSRGSAPTALFSGSDLGSDYTSLTYPYSDSGPSTQTMRNSLTALLSGNPFNDPESDDGSDYTSSSICSESSDEQELSQSSLPSSSITSRPAGFVEYPQYLIGRQRVLNLKEVKSDVPQRVEAVSPFRSMEALVERLSHDSVNSLRESLPENYIGAALSPTEDSLFAFSPVPSLALMTDTRVQKEEPPTDLPQNSTGKDSKAPKKLRVFTRKFIHVYNRFGEKALKAIR
ncbi:hypothetical protein BZA77DRAFT_356984 [Pyronema omphalodes]|nr:hypothetical protein BZA77DRAFT_356984 [Pyronema omphalodes]